MARLRRRMTFTRRGRFIDALIEKDSTGIDAGAQGDSFPGRIITKNNKADPHKRAKGNLRRELKIISAGS